MSGKMKHQPYCNCGSGFSSAFAHDDLCPVYISLQAELALKLVDDMAKEVSAASDGFIDALEDLVSALQKINHIPEANAALREGGE